MLAPAAAAGIRDDVEVVPVSAEYAAGGLARRRAILGALRAAPARIYVQRSAGFETGIVGAWARVTRGRFVFSSSSEADFTLDRETARSTGASLDEWPSRLQYRLGLRLADRVVVQTQVQRELARGFGVEAAVVPSFAEAAEPSARPREVFLWIGGLVGIKDPLAYVELARRVPEARFWMVAGERAVGGSLASRVRAEAKLLSNLELLSPCPRPELLELNGRAVAIVNTARLEGFPNTFLEAWARGTPGLSLRVDPDGVIATNDLGVVAGGSMDALAYGARTLWAERENVDPARTQAYARGVHDPAVVSPQWAEIVHGLLAR